MKKLRTLFVGIIFINVFFACKTKKNQTTINQEIVIENRNIHKEILSPDKTKILVLDYVDKMEIPILFNYKVIDSKSKKELISGVYSGVKIEWEDNYNLKAHSYIAIVEKDNDTPEKYFTLIKVQ